MLLFKHRTREPHIRHVFHNLSHNLRAVRLSNLNLLFWIPLIKTNQYLRQKILRRYGRRRNRNTVLLPGILPAETLFNLLLQIYNLPGIFI